MISGSDVKLIDVYMLVECGGEVDTGSFNLKAYLWTNEGRFAI